MNEYTSFRNALIANPDTIIELEKAYFNSLFNEILSNASKIKEDFDKTMALKDFWFPYAPRQRGHKPSGNALPWGEVGEKVLEAYLYKAILNLFPTVRFIGLPYGHDVRFVTDNAFIHLDIKSTGPTDNADEVVSSPNQVTGDGLFYDETGIQNSKISVVGASREMAFQPELPPFYIIDNQCFITLTFYLKCVYKVVEIGIQPLDYLELIGVPNGLLMFDTLNYAQKVKGLLTPGKDILTSAHKRTRIKLNPLAEIATWRCRKISFETDERITLHHRKAI
ncbi:MAG: hypothetical protein RL329_2477 [Bacteroidota bacterium]|jgi:hypothetical protein